MVQREIADRLRAAPGSRIYGSPSVLAQLACEVRAGAHRRPGGLQAAAAGRVGDPAPAPHRARPPTRRRATSSAPPSPTGASPSPAPWSTPAPASLAPARAALARARPPPKRSRRAALAEGVSRLGEGPVQVGVERLVLFLRHGKRTAEPCLQKKLSETPTWTGPVEMRILRPRQAQPLPLPRAAPRGRPARAVLAVRAAGARRPDRGRPRRSATRSSAPGSRARTWRRGRWRRCARAGWDRPPLRVEIEKRIPVAAGLGGGSADARGDRCGLRGRRGRRTVPRRTLAAEIGADVPSQLDPSLALVRGRRRAGRAPPRPGAPRGRPAARRRRAEHRRGLRRGRPPRARPRRPRSWKSLAERLRDAAGAGASPLDYADLLVNDLEPAARSLRPDIGDALDALRAAGAPLALLTGSGPTVFGLFEDLAAARAAADRLDRDDAIVCEAGRAP